MKKGFLLIPVLVLLSAFVADEGGDALVGQLGQGRAERGRVGRWRRAPVGLCAGPLRNRQNAALLSACESAVGASVVLRTENGVLAECLTLMRDGMNEPTGAMDLTLFSDTGERTTLQGHPSSISLKPFLARPLLGQRTEENRLRERQITRSSTFDQRRTGRGNQKGETAQARVGSGK